MSQPCTATSGRAAGGVGRPVCMPRLVDSLASSELLDFDLKSGRMHRQARTICLSGSSKTDMQGIYSIVRDYCENLDCHQRRYD